jgi:hypothetical protein
LEKPRLESCESEPESEGGGGAEDEFFDRDADYTVPAGRAQVSSVVLIKGNLIERSEEE